MRPRNAVSEFTGGIINRFLGLVDRAWANSHRQRRWAQKGMTDANSGVEQAEVGRGGCAPEHEGRGVSQGGHQPC